MGFCHFKINYVPNLLTRRYIHQVGLDHTLEDIVAKYGTNWKLKDSIQRIVEYNEQYANVCPQLGIQHLCKYIIISIQANWRIIETETVLFASTDATIMSDIIYYEHRKYLEKGNYDHSKSRYTVFSFIEWIIKSSGDAKKNWVRLV